MAAELRFSSHPNDVKKYTTQELRDHYLIQDLFQLDVIKMVYSMHDRMVTMGCLASEDGISLPAFEDYTKAEFFLERREMGIINVGGAGKVTVDDEEFSLEKKECLYIGKGQKEILFSSDSGSNPAAFYICSCPAHHSYPTTKASLDQANRVELGSSTNSNERTIFQFIHEDGIASCQLVMGFTELAPGNVWNTFPPHTHNRRMEMYFYFDVPEDQLVMHFMGQADETRHIAMRNREAVISPEWSIHSGAGTSAYSFIWSMAGENKAFTDMDGIGITEIK